ncbi:SDR family NAD(P)-dependent oxidoreductase [Mycobacteroides franklinii]|uniref:3-oxoacyl-[acyl-carrier-protein] reductase FabG n=1 Tax=Mycobacteroides franklinii TaxID=948102 RepID=A0A4R8R1F4_9MYCO|nr:SDR family oxidoreductase [Mycobacteroides franklinii]TDZ46370.1 3-oxoacyl-[acyl-carrier-protein] reductase FabG [Mycobacteroides franklinii]TDZ47879.1 3-oxoacyl-[acyl-carrier-protein] reductase FabG [Mycobacteroides franklinii]TDZ60088.1 3-oxoacyl-[acyl-carrier-protein] reductase FabG [Mycobacteroides franklinii]TDZ65487.1 3-oxoacyl-[acyl-carrier-protein] reductase FabG [Mycobacteroides franklinii]TDZ73656.1 3-oxoacyl-[acyl-carrier-protein] reductase FabG [Mycobacteroides franklinii]
MNRETYSRLFDLTGRTAVVTGGTRGIGRALAEGYACAGANVVVASRKPETCAETVEHLRALGARALGVPTHTGDIESLEQLVRATVEEFGGIDIVVNNAANALTEPVGAFTVDGWDKSFGVNLRGPVFLVQAALPHLVASRHAAVLNVVSVGAFMFGQGVSMYSAAKAALVAYTRSAAAELAVRGVRGVRVNALAPGAIDTDMVRKTPQAEVERMANANHLKRLGLPDEMVGTALLLTSDAGSYITGQTIIADGGLVAR